ncbi:flavin-containing monooxygenase [Pseudonocardia acaciae]|uniref:flavin-containing monooxygenase n=1 Tax=Pseudonocardia acaciae TaxID=551276 RepID=UPI0004919C7F|nr:NAD(P)/FAD-dependent oxidoreductase [Pseudonocardia acaciae]
MAEEHVDVLIVGAGLSGIGAACHLRRACPGKTFTILEARDAIGGTWDLFRYPGVRSDSDMFTLGYSFKPWTQAKAIADGDSIRDYVRETAGQYGIDREVRFGHRVVRAEWSSKHARWTVEALRADTGETVRFTCSLLFACSGYYRYDQGYTPDFEGIEDFAGQVVHPQHWPEDLDYSGKRVLVIGSGATAVTLVPSMADTAGHVTMLQRSPSYVLSLPSVDPAAERLRRLLPTKTAYAAVRWMNMFRMMLLFQLSRRKPDLVKRLLRKGLRAQLPAGYDVDTHFTPTYNPWDQRMCFVPDGDLLKAIKRGRASVVTDRIERFTERGVRLTSGTELEADVIVTATGLNLVAMGGVTLTVDGADVELPKTVAYKGMMLSGVPNFVYTLGYTNASWTLKADLVAEYVCRLLKHMDAHGYRSVTPLEPTSPAREPLIDLKSGYVRRGLDKMPKQGASAPWRLHQNYPRDVLLLRHGSVEDEGVEFARAPVGQGASVA